MATIYSSELQKEIAQAAKIQQGVDQIPSKLSDVVVPVIEVNPKTTKVANFVKASATTSSGSVTMFTTPTGKDFYLTGVTMSYEKDATSDATSMTFFATVDGVQSNIIDLRFLTTTASRQFVTREFTKPIKIDQNVAIGHFTSFTAGNMSRAASFQGYFIENSRA